jgi:hypothetical protein
MPEIVSVDSDSKWCGWKGSRPILRQVHSPDICLQKMKETIIYILGCTASGPKFELQSSQAGKCGWYQLSRDIYLCSVCISQWALCHEGVWRKWRIAPPFFTSAPCRGERWDLLPCVEIDCDAYALSCRVGTGCCSSGNKAAVAWDWPLISNKRSSVQLPHTSLWCGSELIEQRDLFRQAFLISPIRATCSAHSYKRYKKDLVEFRAAYQPSGLDPVLLRVERAPPSTLNMRTRQLPYPFLLDTCPFDRTLLLTAETLYAETYNWPVLISIAGQNRGLQWQIWIGSEEGNGGDTSACICKLPLWCVCKLNYFSKSRK